MVILPEALHLLIIMDFIDHCRPIKHFLNVFLLFDVRNPMKLTITCRFRLPTPRSLTDRSESSCRSYCSTGNTLLLIVALSTATSLLTFAHGTGTNGHKIAAVSF
jgi:hypothetical protein